MGWMRANAFSTCGIRLAATTWVTATLSSRLSCAEAAVTRVLASSISLMIRLAEATRLAPAGVKDTERVVRSNRRQPNWASRSRIMELRPACVM